MDERYLEKRKGIEEVFARYSKLDEDAQVEISSSGLYQLEISRYGELGKVSWEYSRGIVRKLADHSVIADVKRNYGHFWHGWIDHPNGNEYLLCGEDYQGYSIVNLATRQSRVYFPEAGYTGGAFCWAAVHPSPDRLVLAVDGCIWACPYELRFFDFRTPDRLPFAEIGNVPNLAECKGWVDNETFVIEQEIVVRKRDGARYEQLSRLEQESLDADDSLIDYRREEVKLTRPDVGQKR